MKEYKLIARQYLSAYSDLLRTRRNLTQERMAEKLRISSRAYSDLERGKCCFSCTSLLFLMMMLEHDEVDSLLDGFQEKVNDWENGGNDGAFN